MFNDKCLIILQLLFSIIISHCILQFSCLFGHPLVVDIYIDYQYSVNCLTQVSEGLCTFLAVSQKMTSCFHDSLSFLRCRHHDVQRRTVQVSNSMHKSVINSSISKQSSSDSAGSRIYTSVRLFVYVTLSLVQFPNQNHAHISGDCLLVFDDNMINIFGFQSFNTQQLILVSLNCPLQFLWSSKSDRFIFW